MSTSRKIAVPATRSSATVLKARRRIVVVVLVAAALSGFLALLLTLRSDPPPPPASSGVNTRLAAVAEQAGRDFLAGRNSVVPAADGVDTMWSGVATPIPTEEQPLTKEQADAILNGVSGVNVGAFSLQGESVHRLGDADQQTVHLIRFRVLVNASPFTLTVPMIDDPDHGSVLGGTPSLTATTSGTIDIPAADYTDTYDGATNAVPETVQDSLDKWVTAYTTSGRNSDALRTVTGDQDPSRTYSGLGLGRPGTLSEVVSTIPVPAGQGPAGLVVQIRVALPVNAATGFNLSSTYDLYVVTEGDPAQPPVVAWGAAGSAEQLVPFMNAN